MLTVLVSIASFVLGAVIYRHFRIYRRVHHNWRSFLKTSQSKATRIGRTLSVRWQQFRTPEPVTMNGYVRDKTIDYCVETFERRSRAWKFFATVSFFFSLASVIVGILIFVFASRIAMDNPELERLLERRDSLQVAVDSGMSKMDEGQREFVISKQLLDDWIKLRGPISRFARDDLRDPENLPDTEKTQLRLRRAIWLPEREIQSEALLSLGIVDREWLRGHGVIVGTTQW